MKKKRNMQLLLVSMHTIALCLAGCSGEDEDIKNHVDNDEVFTSLHVHPKGLYVARIIAFEKSGNPVTVVESAPEMSTISPWPIVNDTVVVETGGDRSKIRVMKWAIAKVVSDKEEDTEKDKA